MGTNRGQGLSRGPQRTGPLLDSQSSHLCPAAASPVTPAPFRASASPSACYVVCVSHRGRKHAPQVLVLVLPIAEGLVSRVSVSSPPAVALARPPPRGPLPITPSPQGCQSPSPPTPATFLHILKGYCWNPLAPRSPALPTSSLSPSVEAPSQAPPLPASTPVASSPSTRAASTHAEDSQTLPSGPDQGTHMATSSCLLALP